MHPGMMGWWAGRRRAHEESCGTGAGCGPSGGFGHRGDGPDRRFGGHGHDGKVVSDNGTRLRGGRVQRERPRDGRRSLGPVSVRPREPTPSTLAKGPRA